VLIDVHQVWQREDEPQEKEQHNSCNDRRGLPMHVAILDDLGSSPGTADLEG
jgi:hypothetical protein